MARALQNVELIIPVNDAGATGLNADKPGLGPHMTYEIADGAEKKSSIHAIADADMAKIVHNTGAVGELWRDAIDAIKSREGVA